MKTQNDTKLTFFKIIMIKSHINAKSDLQEFQPKKTNGFIIPSRFDLPISFSRPLKFRPSQQNRGEDDATCKYNCKENGGCNVKIETSFPVSGFTSGSCFPPDFGGECSGIPQRCDNCDKKCENKSGEIFSIKANPN